MRIWQSERRLRRGRQQNNRLLSVFMFLAKPNEPPKGGEEAGGQAAGQARPTDRPHGARARGSTSLHERDQRETDERTHSTSAFVFRIEEYPKKANYVSLNNDMISV